MVTNSGIVRLDARSADDEVVFGLLIGDRMVLCPWVGQESTTGTVLGQQVKLRLNQGEPFEVGRFTLSIYTIAAETPVHAPLLRLSRSPLGDGPISGFKDVPGTHVEFLEKTFHSPVDSGDVPLWTVAADLALGSPIFHSGSLGFAAPVVGIVVSPDSEVSTFVSLDVISQSEPRIGLWCGWRAFESSAFRRLWASAPSGQPDEFDDLFSDRNQELRDLYETVEGGSERVVVFGESGAGKSSVLARLAAEGEPALQITPHGPTRDSRHAGLPRVTAWVDFESTRSLGGDLAAALEIDVPLNPHMSPSPSDQLEAIDLAVGRLRPAGTTLVVIDGVRLVEDLRKLLRSLQGCSSMRFIVGSTDAAINGLGVQDLHDLADQPPIEVSSNVDDSAVRDYLSARFSGEVLEDLVRLAGGSLLLAGMFPDDFRLSTSDQKLELKVRRWVREMIERPQLPGKQLVETALWLSQYSGHLPLLERLLSVENLHGTLTEASGVMAHLVDLDGGYLRVRHDLFSSAIEDLFSDGQNIEQIFDRALDLGRQVPAEDEEQNDSHAFYAASEHDSRFWSEWTRVVCGLGRRSDRVHEVVSEHELLKRVDLGLLAETLRSGRAHSPKCQLLETYEPGGDVEPWDLLRSVELALSGRCDWGNRGQFEWDSGPVQLGWWRRLPTATRDNTEKVVAMRLTNKPEPDGISTEVALLSYGSEQPDPIHEEIRIDDLGFGLRYGLAEPQTTILNREHSSNETLVTLRGLELRTADGSGTVPAGARFLQEVDLGGRRLIYTCSTEGELGVASVIDISDDLSAGTPPRKSHDNSRTATTEEGDMVAHSHANGLLNIRLNPATGEPEREVWCMTWSTIHHLEWKDNRLHCETNAGTLRFTPDRAAVNSSDLGARDNS